jgi:hypothetical protein
LIWLAVDFGFRDDGARWRGGSGSSEIEFCQTVPFPKSDTFLNSFIPRFQIASGQRRPLTMSGTFIVNKEVGGTFPLIMSGFGLSDDLADFPYTVRELLVFNIITGKYQTKPIFGLRVAYCCLSQAEFPLLLQI